jgi:hypothetical protein
LGVVAPKTRILQTDRQRMFFYFMMLSTAKIIPSGAKIILYLIESRGFCVTLNNAT